MIDKNLDIKKNREQMGWSQSFLAEKVGVSLRTIQNYESGGKIPKSKYAIFHIVFNETGNTTQNIKISQPQEIFKTKSGNIIDELPSGKFLLTVPLVPHKAQATYISEHEDADYVSDLTKVSFIVDKVPQGKYMAFEIKNDSMNDASLDRPPSRDAILHGDIVLGRELQKLLWRNKLRINGVNGYPFWIIVHQKGIFCKQIVKHEVKEGVIWCHSLNNSPEFERDFSLKLNECYQLFNIIKKQI